MTMSHESKYVIKEANGPFPHFHVIKEESGWLFVFVKNISPDNS